MYETLAKSECHYNSKMWIVPTIADCYRPVMQTARETRRYRLVWLADTRCGGYMKGGFVRMADRMDRKENYFSQLNTGHRYMGDALAREIEQTFDLAHGLMDTPLDPATQEHVDALLKAAEGRVRRKPQDFERRSTKAAVVALPKKAPRKEAGKRPRRDGKRGAM